MKPADEDKLRALAQTVAAGAGYDLEELAVVAAGRRQLIRVVVDADGGVTLDAAAQVSRALAAELDAAGDAFLGPAPYTLEVSSPGIGRPLTEERHFRRARGRLVSVKLIDGDTVEGRVRRVAGDSLELLTGNDVTTTKIALADIRRAKVEVEFAKMPAAHADLLAADGFVDGARAFDDVDAELAPLNDLDGDAIAEDSEDDEFGFDDDESDDDEFDDQFDDDASDDYDVIDAPEAVDDGTRTASKDGLQ